MPTTTTPKTTCVNGMFPMSNVLPALFCSVPSADSIQPKQKRHLSEIVVDVVSFLPSWCFSPSKQRELVLWKPLVLSTVVRDDVLAVPSPTEWGVPFGPIRSRPALRRRPTWKGNLRGCNNDGDDDSSRTTWRVRCPQGTVANFLILGIRTWRVRVLCQSTLPICRSHSLCDGNKNNEIRTLVGLRAFGANHGRMPSVGMVR